MVGAGGGVGKPRVGLEDQRQVGPLPQLGKQGDQLLRAEAAVEAERVDPEARQRQGHGRHRRADKGASARFEAHGDPDGQVGVLLRGEHRGLDLVQIAHGLDDDEVGPGLRARGDLLPEGLVGLLEAQRAEGLEQLAERADVQGHLDGQIPRGHAGAANAPFDQLRRGIAAARRLIAVGAEGIRVEQAAACLDVFPVDGGDLFWLGNVPDLRGLAQRQTGGLQHGPHAAVEKQDLRVLHSFFHPF